MKIKGCIFLACFPKNLSLITQSQGLCARERSYIIPRSLPSFPRQQLGFLEGRGAPARPSPSPVVIRGPLHVKQIPSLLLCRRAESWLGWTLLPQLHPLFGTGTGTGGATLQVLLTRGKREILGRTRRANTPPAMESEFSEEETEAQKTSSKSNHEPGGTATEPCVTFPVIGTV